MTGITKALQVLSGAAVALLLSAGTDELAVRNIVNGIAQTASLAVAPILRDLPPAPQLRGDPAREMQKPGAADSAAESVAAPASVDANRVPALTDGPVPATAGTGSCGPRCGGTTFSGPVRDGLTTALGVEVNGDRGSDRGNAEVAASSRHNPGGISASAAGSASAFRGALGRAPSNASPPASANRGTTSTDRSQGLAIGGGSSAAVGSTVARTTNGDDSSLGSNTSVST